MELISGTKFDFLGKRWLAYILSLTLAVCSIYLWISRGEGRYDIDFRGGHELIVQVKGESSSDRIRKALEDAKVGDALVQSFESSKGQYSIRVGLTGSDAQVASKEVNANVKKALASVFNGADSKEDNVAVISSDFVGPAVGKELKEKAALALILSLISMLIYVTIRFEFAFALGAVVALFHDVIIATGVYLAAGHDINMASVAAALTIVGYSVNDTIVIFDRIREEIYKRQHFELVPLINECINATLSRTIITSLLTLFSALALVIWGGGAISDLSVFLVAGIIVGSYSTIFIASPIVIAWEHFRTRKAPKSSATQQA